MNKDVIYIEPEDDITDIITKIENSPEKITVLVPPKKAGVLRSVVNIKLIAKAAAAAEKTVVLVTVDPSIIKLAAASRIPVTKDLKTPPTIPELDDELADNTETEVIEEEYDEVTETAPEPTHENPDEVVENPVENSEITEEDETSAEDDQKAKKAKKAKKPAKNFKEWIKNHKIPVAIGSVALVGIIAFLIWAFGFAPAVTVDVEIQTELKSFAENVTFTTNSADENAKEGKFYLQEKKIDSVQEVKFEASGKKNMGDKAKGNIEIYYNFDAPGTVTVNSGDVFTANGLKFTVEQGTSLSVTMKDLRSNNCDNDDSEDYCMKSGTISVVAAEPGSQYNVGNTTSWANGVGVAVSSSSISGGSDKNVTVVEPIDVEKAKDQLKASGEEENKKKLLETVGDNMMPIESSFKLETSTAESTPAAGQEVGDGVTPVLKAVTTASIYAIDKTKLEEFITEKAQIGDDQRIYEIKDFYIENFTGTNGNFSGRLKANYYVGPKISESEILDKIKGKGLGDVQHDLKNINGVIGVTINTSYPWVNVVPGDSNKITINLSVKDKNGEKTQNEDDNADANRGDGNTTEDQK